MSFKHWLAALTLVANTALAVDFPRMAVSLGFHRVEVEVAATPEATPANTRGHTPNTTLPSGDTISVSGISPCQSLSIAATNTVQSEGNDGTTPFTFTVTSDSHLDENTSGAVYLRTLANALVDRPDHHVVRVNEEHGIIATPPGP